MDTNKPAPQDVTSRSPAPSPNRPLQRRVIDGFTTPRPVQPKSAPTLPRQQSAPFTTTASAAPRPLAAQPLNASPPKPPTSPRPSGDTYSMAGIDAAPPDSKKTITKPRKEPSSTGHAGFVGFVTFALLATLLLSPLVPGKILQNFPGSSQSFSTGDQTLDCLGRQGQISSTTSYDTKLGSPVTYKYATSTKQSATCDSAQQSAITGHTSQFNPFGLAVDLFIALAIAVATAKLWRSRFGEKH